MPTTPGKPKRLRRSAIGTPAQRRVVDMQGGKHKLIMGHSEWKRLYCRTVPKTVKVTSGCKRYMQYAVEMITVKILQAAMSSVNGRKQTKLMVRDLSSLRESDGFVVNPLWIPSDEEV